MITGKTRIFGIIAHPTVHVKTPQAMNALFQRDGIDAVMAAFDVAPDELADFVAGLRGVQNFGGLVVTVPHKSAIAGLCDRLSARAEAAGAVNSIRREADGSLSGDLLDGVGFVAGLKAAGHGIAGRRVWLAGAGGAASAIALALAEGGVERLTLVNRSPAKLEVLAARLRARFPALDLVIGGSPAGHDLVINGTSLGLQPDDALPLDPADLDPAALVAEVVIVPEVTPLLAAAAARGCATHPGKAMLQGQIAEIMAFITASGPRG